MLRYIPGDIILIVDYHENFKSQEEMSSENVLTLIIEGAILETS